MRLQVDANGESIKATVSLLACHALTKLSYQTCLKFISKTWKAKRKAQNSSYSCYSSDSVTTLKDFLNEAFVRRKAVEALSIR
jgi:hypothetical protein